MVENTFSLHEDAMVDLITKHNVKRVCFTGHSLGGGVANVAHLVVRAQLKKVGSPWAKLDGSKVAWLACTFAAPQTIVRLYEPEKPPPLIVDLDGSSYNVVYNCDAVPRLPSMYKYTTLLVEEVMPQIIVKQAEDKIKLPALLVAAVLVVKFLKGNGVVFVAGQFTHLGTVVYKESEGKDYRTGKPGVWSYSKGTDAIQETLDVKNILEFNKLMGPTQKYGESLLAAHTYYTKLELGAK